MNNHSPPAASHISIQELMDQATDFYQEGQLQQAEALYQKILSIEPQHPDALHMYCNLGNILFKQGRMQDAIESYQHAIAINPESAIAHNNLGTALDTLNKKQEAIACYRKAVAIDPNYIEAHVNLGTTLHELEDYESAQQCYLQALEINPLHVDALYNLGNVQKALSKFSEAAQSYRAAISVNPDRGEFYANLGGILITQGNNEEAVDVYRKALTINPDSADCYYNLANALNQHGKVDEAINYYQQALLINPNHVESLNNLGITLGQQNRLGEALAQYQKALNLNVNNAAIHFNIGLILQKQGKLKEAIEALHKAIEINPDYYEAHTSSIFVMDMQPSISSAMVQQERRQWGQRYADHLLPTSAFRNNRDANRRIRIGYVSGDFREHSAATVFAAMLMLFDQTKFEVTAYSNSIIEDNHTLTIKNNVDRWRNITALSDDDASTLIQQDEIDILVDLSGHSASNRLLLFARKPAPIQISAWGYIGGTGMPAMDVFFADTVVVPPEEVPFYAEEVRYLTTLVCYYAFTSFPPVNTLPALVGHGITFGSYNRLAKINDETFQLWAQVLSAIPNSKLIMKTPELDDPSCQSEIHQSFLRYGISSDRIKLLGKSTWNEHVAAFNQIDISLDPYPHGGGVTTIEGIMMGIPVITLKWPTLLGRLSAAILTPLGLTDWIAETPEQYVDIAVQKSADLMALAVLRKQLRNTMTNSLVGNPKAYVQAVEQEYRFLWQRWCEKKQGAE